MANNPTTWVDPTGHSYAPPLPRAGGATESLAPYVVGAAAAGQLGLLGLKLRDTFTLLGLVLSGAWVILDIWDEVRDEELGCKATADDLRSRCQTWAKTGKQFRCCDKIVSQGQSNCQRGIPWWPPMP